MHATENCNEDNNMICTLDTETCRQCISSWWPLDWFGYLHELSDWWGVPLVLFVLTDGERDGLCWPALSGHWLSCTECCQYLLNMKYLMHELLFLQLFTSQRCFHPRTLKKRIGLVTMDLLYIKFTYYSQATQQEGFSLSNRFSLWWLGPWMNHLPPVPWSGFMFMFLKESWCVSLT